MSEKKLLEVKSVSKTFGNTRALRDVSWSVREGEIHGLLGENGAGKTTLMNIVYGLYKPDKGEIYINGARVSVDSPHDALSHKIGMVHQHFTLVADFTVLENVILGMKQEGNFLTEGLKEEKEKLEKLSAGFGLEIPIQSKVRELPVGVQQRVEILRALFRGASILILDEPTANLVPSEVDKLFISLRAMVDKGLTIVFITHKIREAMSVCDRITVLKSGQIVETFATKSTTAEQLVALMVGKEIETEKSILFSKHADESTVTSRSEKPVLTICDLDVSKDKKLLAIKNCSLEVYGGEIVGIAGISGNGQKELLDSILKLRSREKGEVFIAGRNTKGLTTCQIYDMGVVYVPEDRLREGVLPLVSVADNLILGRHKNTPFCEKKFGLSWLDSKQVSSVSKQLIDDYHIKTPDEKAVAGILSGGNIQRLMLARAFSQESKLVIAHNPTRGLDIASVEFVLEKIVEFKRKGAAVLYLSEDLDELLLICDRIAVIYKGEIVGTSTKEKFDKYKIGLAMLGVEKI